MSKCNENELEINGQAYRKVDTIGEKLRLIVVDNRGLTFVGRCDLSGNNEEIVIRNARCVIYWGTDAHLAQLTGGPRSDTRLGHMGDVTVWRKHLVVAYDLDEAGWKDV